jgi:hypothetical protein
MKQSNHDTCDEDDREGKSDKSHNSFRDEKEKQELLIKEALLEGPSS